jgi:aminopeptidase N
VEPSLQIGQQFTISETQKVFEVDSLMSSHAMSFPVKKRNEINELFDSIPYSKGMRGLAKVTVEGGGID